MLTECRVKLARSSCHAWAEMQKVLNVRGISKFLVEPRRSTGDLWAELEEMLGVREISGFSLNHEGAVVILAGRDNSDVECARHFRISRQFSRELL